MPRTWSDLNTMSWIHVLYVSSMQLCIYSCTWLAQHDSSVCRWLSNEWTRGLEICTCPSNRVRAVIHYTPRTTLKSECGKCAVKMAEIGMTNPAGQEEKNTRGRAERKERKTSTCTDTHAVNHCSQRVYRTMKETTRHAGWNEWLGGDELQEKTSNMVVSHGRLC